MAQTVSTWSKFVFRDQVRLYADVVACVSTEGLLATALVQYFLIICCLILSCHAVNYDAAGLAPMAGVTMLIPSNKALLNLGFATLQNESKMKKIGMYNIIVGKMAYAMLLKQKNGKMFKTISNSTVQLLNKNPKVSFKTPKVTPARVTNINTDGKNLFTKGKWIWAHGTDNYLKPASVS